MADINQVVLVGRLTRDSVLKYTTSGGAICNFSVAVNRRRKSGEEWIDEASFFDIALFGRQGESLSRYLQKGKQVAIQGDLRQYCWEKDGQNYSKVGVVANNIQLLGGNNSGQSDQNSNNSQTQNQQGHSQQQPSTPAPSYNMDDFDDEIPF